MSIIHPHPPFCDPAACTPLGGDLLHKSPAFTVRDVLAVVCLSRLDDLGVAGGTGPDRVRMRPLDLESENARGGDVEAVASFDAVQARLFAAALVCAADQLDAQQAGGAR